MSHISVTVLQRKERKAPGDRGHAGLRYEKEKSQIAGFRIARVLPGRACKSSSVVQNVILGR